MLGLVGEYDSRIMEMQAKIDELKACKDVMVSAFGVKYMETFMNDNGETRNKDITGSSYACLQTSFAVLCVSYGGGEEFFFEAREALRRHDHQGDAPGRDSQGAGECVDARLMDRVEGGWITSVVIICAFNIQQH